MDLSNIITQVSKPEEAGTTEKKSLIVQSECNNNTNSNGGHKNGSSPGDASITLLPMEASTSSLEESKSQSANVDGPVWSIQEDDNSVQSPPPAKPSVLQTLLCCCSQPSSKSSNAKRRQKTGGSSLGGSGGLRGSNRRASQISRESMEDCVDRTVPDARSGFPHGHEVEEGSGDRMREPVLLRDPHPDDVNKKCLIIDLDETLVHSSFKPVQNPNFIVKVEIEGIEHEVYVLKRPHVDEFLQRVGKLFECVLFTASLGKYADPVVDLLDHWDVFKSRLFRESCVLHGGNYVKNLAQLGREVSQVVILDNSPASFLFHPQHAVHISSWFDDPNDTALLELIPYFEEMAASPNAFTFLQSRVPPGTAGHFQHSSLFADD